jgi:hypothetical protein
MNSRPKTVRVAAVLIAFVIAGSAGTAYALKCALGGDPEQFALQPIDVTIDGESQDLSAYSNRNFALSAFPMEPDRTPAVQLTVFSNDSDELQFDALFVEEPAQ